MEKKNAWLLCSEAAPQFYIIRLLSQSLTLSVSRSLALTRSLSSLSSHSSPSRFSRYLPNTAIVRVRVEHTAARIRWGRAECRVDSDRLRLSDSCTVVEPVHLAIGTLRERQALHALNVTQNGATCQSKRERIRLEAWDGLAEGRRLGCSE